MTGKGFLGIVSPLQGQEEQLQSTQIELNERQRVGQPVADNQYPEITPRSQVGSSVYQPEKATQNNPHYALVVVEKAKNDRTDYHR